MLKDDVYKLTKQSMSTPTEIIHLIGTFVGRNPYRAPAMTRCLASIKCSMLWLKIRDKKRIFKSSRKIEKLKRLGARLSDARSIHLHLKILDQYHIQLKDGFKCYCGMRDDGYLPDKPIWNMLKCWLRGVCPQITKECLRVLRAHMLDGMVGGHTLRDLQVPELHHQLFLIAILKARQEQFGESMYGETPPARPRVPAPEKCYVGCNTRGPYVKWSEPEPYIDYDPEPSHPFYY